MLITKLRAINIKKSWLYILTGCLLMAVAPVFAEDAKDLATVANNIKTNVDAVANLLVIVAYVAGVGFTLGGIVQFKAHKDNPAQVPLSKPLVYIGVGAFLLFMPQLMKTAGQTIFGTTEDSGAGGTTGL